MKKRKWIFLVLLAAVLLVLIVVFHHLIWVLLCNWFPKKMNQPPAAAWDGGESWEHLPYADASENQYLDLYVPSAEEPVPIFVLVHGGGFIANDSQSRQAVWMYRYFRDHGFACASVNYRLAQEAPYPAAVEDIHAAVCFLAAHSAEYGLDPERIAIWGESAGGYLAVREAVTETEVRIAALVDDYGVLDFASSAAQFEEEGIPAFVRAVANSWMRSDLLEGYSTVEEYWLRKPASDWTDEERQDLSVLRQAERFAPAELKSLLIHGDADITVPYHQSMALQQILAQRCGADHVALRLVHGAMHAGDSLYTDEMLGQVEAFLRDALGMEN